MKQKAKLVKLESESQRVHKIVTYTRVSTGHQDVKSQLHSILELVASKGFKNTTDFQEVVSGSVSWKERELKSIIDGLDTGDTLIVAELSRIGRSVSDVLECCEYCISRGIVIYIAKGGQCIDSSMSSKIWRTIMALAAEIERDFIRMRTTEGIANAKAKGVKLGRPKGKAKTYKLDKQEEYILKLLASKVNVTNICKILNVTRATLYRWLKHKKININQGELDF
jgi:DNA invertase Pin-like site-specific DNA recombinase